MSAPEKLARCADVAPLLVFYACDEVEPRERAAIEAHLAQCEACAAQWKDEETLNSAVLELPHAADQLDPSGLLLSQCRSELSEALDDLAAPPLRPSWHPLSQFRKWMALRPAWSAAALLVLGGAFTAQALQWFPAASKGPALNVVAPPSISDDQLSKMSLSGISLIPAPNSAPGTVQLQLHTEQPFVLAGNADDTNVRRVLTYVVENSERFDPGVRLDCVDALKTRVHDMQVRGVLLAAARKDQSPAVRMKALESLRDAAADDSVREAILATLESDRNPGVRVEAINLLIYSLDGTAGDSADSDFAPEVAAVPRDTSTERVVHALEELQRHDADRYVRLRSAAALRQIGQRELQ